MINIIGGGPAGLYTAHFLAKQRDVTVHEEHRTIGKPVQCTGIVTSEIKKLVRPEVINHIKRARIVAGSVSTTLPVDDLVIDRTAFDRKIRDMAIDSGVVIQYGKRIRTIPKGTVIGADGPNSILYRQLNKRPQQFLVGRQARVKGEFDPDIFEVHMGSVAPGFFAWVVPESAKTARVGLATKSKTAYYFERFMRRKDFKAIDSQGGLIPVYDRSIRTEHQGRYLVGDSAGQVKATTGGGLVPGLKCAKVLSDSILSSKSYEKTWRREVGTELWMHSFIRKRLNRYSNKKYEMLIKKIEKNKDVFYRYGRDNIMGLALNLLLKDPLIVTAF